MLGLVLVFNLAMVPALSSANDLLTTHFQGFDYSYQLLWTLISGGLTASSNTVFLILLASGFFQLILVIFPRIPTSLLCVSSQIFSLVSCSFFFVSPHNDISDHTIDISIIGSYHCLFPPLLYSLSS